ncbi:MAG: hypothetical protein HOQ05_05515 [Corynebacteriales bacterium]|nr:hypothetical protein [Mycobacteriales bacterium]
MSSKQIHRCTCGECVVGHGEILITPDHIQCLLDAIQLYCRIPAVQLLGHQATMSAADKQALLPEKVLVQKSITVSFDGLTILVSGMGDFKISRALFRRTAALLGLPSSRAKHHQLNPEWLEPFAMTGLKKGMVSPFFAPSHAKRLPYDAVVLLEPITQKPGEYVAVSLSLAKSLLVPASHLYEVIQGYAARIYPQISVHSLRYT